MPDSTGWNDQKPELKKDPLWGRQHGGSHYDHPIQPTLFCYVNKLNVLESNIIKYVCRHRKKDGALDIKKLIHYAEMILEMEYADTEVRRDDQVGEQVDSGRP